MMRLEQIRGVHLEITTKCNAACPQCARNVWGSVEDPSYDQTEIYLDEFKEFFKPEFLAQLHDIFMCGTYGDPAVARDCLPIWKYIKECKPGGLSNLHTNGGIRTPEWWEELAQYCRQAFFGFDGLEDTNHLYRQNVNWKRAVENAKAFIDGGGRAVWVMNVFKHNQHQVDEAKRLALAMGFEEFIVRKTARFYWPSRGLVTRLPVFDKDGRVSHFLEMPTNLEYLNEVFSEQEQREAEENNLKMLPRVPDHIRYVVEDKLKRKRLRLKNNGEPKREIPADVRKKFDGRQVCCRAQANKEIYVSASGLVWPCCFLSVNEWGMGPMQFQVDEIFRKIEGSMDTLNFRKHSLNEIVNGEFFQKHVPESWNKATLAEGKLYDCAYWCPKGKGHFQSEYDVSAL